MSPTRLTMVVFVATCLILLVPIFPTSVHATNPTPTLPPGIISYAQITISNSQPQQTPSQFQQMISIDWQSDCLSCQSYLASNLMNVEFFYANGTIIPSWLESGASSSGTSVYWLKIADPIQAGSQLGINVGFASTTTNLFDGQLVGESPQLSATYGAYDNGMWMFPYYQVWGGLSSLPVGWNFGGGAKASFQASYAILTDPGTNGDAEVSAPVPTTIGTTPYILDYSGNQYLGSGGFVDCFGLEKATGCGNSAAGNEVGVSEQSGSPTLNLLTNGFENSSGIDDIASQNNVYTLELVNQFRAGMAFNYRQLLMGTQANSITGTKLGFYWHVQLCCTTNYPVVVNWIRSRAYPPNNVMPTRTIGQFVSVIVSVSCSPSPVVLDQSSSCKATVTGKSPTGTITWSSGTGTFSPMSCTLTAGSCQVAFSPSDGSSPTTISASYSGDSNNQAATGSFSLPVSKAVTQTTTSCSPSPDQVSHATICKATVAGHSPTGIVTWASSGVSNFSPTSSCTLSQYSCSVTYTPASQDSPITITATYAGDSNNQGSSGTFTLDVSPQSPDFSLTANPASIATDPSHPETSLITVTPLNGFAGTVSLSEVTSPTGLSCTLSSSSIIGGSGSSTLSCSGPAGSYTSTVTGNSGSLSHSVLIPVTLTAGSSNLPGMTSDLLYIIVGVIVVILAAIGIITIRSRKKPARQPSS